MCYEQYVTEKKKDPTLKHFRLLPIPCSELSFFRVEFELNETPHIGNFNSVTSGGLWSTFLQDFQVNLWWPFCFSNMIVWLTENIWARSKKLIYCIENLSKLLIDDDKYSSRTKTIYPCFSVTCFYQLQMTQFMLHPVYALGVLVNCKCKHFMIVSVYGYHGHPGVSYACCNLWWCSLIEKKKNIGKFKSADAEFVPKHTVCSNSSKPWMPHRCATETNISRTIKEVLWISIRGTPSMKNCGGVTHVLSTLVADVHSPSILCVQLSAQNGLKFASIKGQLFLSLGYLSTQIAVS